MSADQSGATYSTKHPHEPEVPPALDSEGRCHVCGLQVALAERDAAYDRLRAAVGVFLDAVDDDADLYLVGDAWNAYQRLRKEMPNV